MWGCVYGKKPFYLKTRLCLALGGDGAGLSFSHKWRGRTFGDGVIAVLAFGILVCVFWGGVLCFFCKTRMCPVLIVIVVDFHKKPRPEPFVKYQFGQHAFLPCWHRQKGNCAGPRACSAPAGWCSTYHDLGFFSAGNGRAAVNQRKLWAVQNACKWSTCRLLQLFAAQLWIELCLSFTRWRNRMVWLMMSCRTAGSVQSATMQGKLEKWV